MADLAKLDAEPLTERERAFAEKFVECGIGAEAMRRLDPEAKFPAQTACKMLARPAVRAYVDELRATSQGDSIASHRELCERLTGIARANLADFLDGAGAIRPEVLADPAKAAAVERLQVDEATDAQGRTIRRVRVVLRDSIAAMDRLARLRGYFDSPEEAREQRPIVLVELPPLSLGSRKDGG